MWIPPTTFAILPMQIHKWMAHMGHCTSCKNVESIIGFNFTEFAMRRSGSRFNVGIRDLLQFLATWKSEFPCELFKMWQTQQMSHLHVSRCLKFQFVLFGWISIVLLNCQCNYWCFLFSMVSIHVGQFAITSRLKSNMFGDSCGKPSLYGRIWKAYCWVNYHVSTMYSQFWTQPNLKR